MNKLKSSFLLFEKILIKIESFLLILFLTTLLLLSSYQIILRIFFSSAKLWIPPILRAIVLWIAFIGGAKSVQTNHTIKIDIFNKLTKNKIFHTIISFIINFISFLICMYLTYISFIFLKTEKEFADIFTNNIKVWHIELIFPFGFSLMSCHFFIKLIKTN